MDYLELYLEVQITKEELPMQVHKNGIDELHIHNSLLLNQHVGSQVPYGLFIAHRELRYIEYKTSDGREFIAPLPYGTTDEDFKIYLDRIKSSDSMVTLFNVSAADFHNTGCFAKVNIDSTNLRKTFRNIRALYSGASPDFQSTHRGSVQQPIPAGLITKGEIKTCKQKAELHFFVVGILGVTIFPERNELHRLQTSIYNLLQNEPILLEQCYAFAIENGYSRDIFNKRLTYLRDCLKQRHERLERLNPNKSQRNTNVPLAQPETQNDALKQFEQQMEQRQQEELKPKKKGGFLSNLFKGSDK